MRLWLTRNSGKAVGPQCWSIFRKLFFEGLDRLFDNTTWAMIDVYSDVEWSATNLDMSRLAEWVFINTFTGVPRSVHGDFEASVFSPAYNKQNRLRSRR